MNVAVTVRLLVKLFTLQACADISIQFDQVTDVAPLLGVPVRVTVVPLTKLALHTVGQSMPDGELLTVPLPETSTVRIGPVPVKQMTFAVIDPVTIAPDEDIFPTLLFVVTVAETMEHPHAKPVAVSRPVESTVAMSGVFDAHVTWVVMSLVTGG